MILTQEEFVAAIKKYAEDKKVSIRRLAVLMGRPERTVEDWRYKGIKNVKKRQKVISTYPWIFSDNSSEKADPLEVQLKEIIAPHSQTDAPKVRVHNPSETQVLMKIELGRQGIVILSDILQWFIETSPEERNRFRDGLGYLWKNFLELTRAMTGERALELALQERRVKSGNDHD